MNASLDLQPTLDAVVGGVVEDLGFEVAVVNLVRADGDLEVVAVAGSDEARDTLLGTVGSRAAWEELLRAATAVGALRFSDARTGGTLEAAVPIWVPDAPHPVEPDGWDPDDALFAPLMSVTDGLLGVLSVDLPAGGRRPGPGQLELLEMFAAQAQLAIENARLLDAVEAGRRADNSLLTGRLQALIDSAPCAIVELDLAGRVVVWNAAAEHLFGWPAAEVLGRLDPTVPADLLPQVRERITRLVHGERVRRSEVRRLRADGTLIDVELSTSAMLDANGTVSGMLTILTDVTARLQLQRDIQARERAQAAVADLGQRALAGGSVQALLAAAAATVAETLSLPLVEVIRRQPDGRLRVEAAAGRPGLRPAGLFVHPCDSPAARALAAEGAVVVTDVAEIPTDSGAVLARLGVRSSACVLIGTGDGKWGVLAAHSVQLAAFHADDVHFLQAVANVLAAAVARQRVEDEIRHRSLHDGLTGLANRTLLTDRVTMALHHATRSGQAAALMIIDLDGFKDVNDTQGHAAGDRVLRQVADRLRSRLRGADTVARLGGDEFAVCLGQLADPDAAAAVAAELVALLRVPFDGDGAPVMLGGSVGVAVAPTHGVTPGVLLRCADLAMYRAKRERSGWAVYDAAVDEAFAARLAMVKDLRAAVESGDFSLVFQPVLDLCSGEVSSVEALVRWRHPSAGPLSPAEFIPLAEQTGLIFGLTEWVLSAAVEQAAAWHRAGYRLPVSVNLSGVVLGSVQVADHIRALLRRVSLPSHLLTVEVTETALVSEDALAALRRLGELGVAAAVDDFGAGYSSLSYLKRLPVRTLKIDRSFVTRMQDDPRDAVIVRSIVGLAHELGLSVVAEGVESHDVARALAALGVEHAQGYLFSRPLPATELVAWMAARSRTAPSVPRPLRRPALPVAS